MLQMVERQPGVEVNCVNGVRSHLVLCALALVLQIPLAQSAQAALQISAKKTNNVSCTSGVCTPSAKDAVLNATDLANLLASSNIKVESGTLAESIDITAAFNWASRHGLTLDSATGITVRAAVSVAGTGAVKIITNDGGAGGALAFLNGGSLAFLGLSNSLSINAMSYTLENNPKQLASDIGQHPAGNFAFVGNYDASKDGAYSQAVVTADFGGVFEGLGNTIENLTITSSTNACIGMFSEVDGATLRDIALTNLNITTSVQATVGGLAGCTSTGSAAIVGASSSGTVSVPPQSIVGGLIGAIQGSIDNSSSAASVTITGDSSSRADAGGLVGYIAGSIESSYASGTVTGGANTCAGGLAGEASSIVASYATGAVTGGDVSIDSGDTFGVGGLACLANVEQSYATGAVTGGSFQLVYGYAGIGGLVGVASQITNSYATGNVTGGNYSDVGGLVGLTINPNANVFEYSYSTGAETGGTSADVGGLVGLDAFPGDLFDTYWDITTGVANANQGAGFPLYDTGVSGLTSQMLMAKLPKGFSKSIWAQNKKINSGYPYLRAVPPS